MTFLFEYTTGHDIGGGANGGQVASQARADKEAEHQEGRIDLQLFRHLYCHGQHGGQVGHIIHKPGNNNGHDDEKRITEEEIVAYLIRQEIGYLRNPTRLGKAFHNDENSHQEKGGVPIEFFYILNNPGLMIRPLPQQGDERKGHANHAGKETESLVKERGDGQGQD